MNNQKNTKSSYRNILRSSSIIGGASIINVALGLVRMKVAALLLGPAGIGLIGLFSNLYALATAVAGLGIGSAGTRQIADAAGRNDELAIATVRRSLFWATILLALIGSAVFWLFRKELAVFVLSDVSMTDSVGWLALAIIFGVAGSAQGALLNGLRRIGDLSRVSVYSAVLSTVLGIAAIWLWGMDGVVAYIIAVPLTGFIVGHWYVAKLPPIKKSSVSFLALKSQWIMLFKLGAAFMIAVVVSNLGHLLVRSIIQKELGIEALGFFQAASAISVTYIGFVLSAMGADYYPRLTAVIIDHAAVNHMVNEQTEVALLLAGPVFLAMMAVAPWIIQLLYSHEFQQATHILHWQIIGDILKVASWPIAFILLAAGDGRTFVLSETVGHSAFVLFTWIGLPIFGINASGMSFLGMYVIYLPLIYWLAKRRTGFTFQTAIVNQIILLMLCAGVLLIINQISIFAAAFLGLIMSFAYAVYGFSRLAHKTELSGWLGRIAVVAQQFMKKVGVWHE